MHKIMGVIILFSFIHIMYFDHSHHSYSFLFSLPITSSRPIQNSAHYPFFSARQIKYKCRYR